MPLARLERERELLLRALIFYLKDHKRRKTHAELFIMCLIIYEREKVSDGKLIKIKQNLDNRISPGIARYFNLVPSANPLSNASQLQGL